MTGPIPRGPDKGEFYTLTCSFSIDLQGAPKTDRPEWNVGGYTKRLSEAQWVICGMRSEGNPREKQPPRPCQLSVTLCSALKVNIKQEEGPALLGLSFQRRSKRKCRAKSAIGKMTQDGAGVGSVGSRAFRKTAVLAGHPRWPHGKWPRV